MTYEGNATEGGISGEGPDREFDSGRPELAVRLADDRSSGNEATLDQNIGDDDIDQLDKAVERAGGVATLIMSAVFNEAALPPGFAEKYGTAIILANRAAGELSIGNGAGRVDEKTKEERAEDAAEAALDALSDGMENVAEEQKRQREEWAQSSHTYFGATLTGQEWDEMGSDIGKDGKLREWLLARLMLQGKTRKEAEKTADEMSEVFKILGKPESQWTKEEKAKVEAAQHDPDFQRNAAELAEQRGANAAPMTKLENSASLTLGEKSVSAGADVLNTDFPTAPDLTQQHRLAVAATEPLDAPKAPQQIALAATIQAAPIAPSSGGFDV